MVALRDRMIRPRSSSWLYNHASRPLLPWLLFGS